MEELRRPQGLNAIAWVCAMVLGASSCASSPVEHASEIPPNEVSVVVRNLSQPGAFEVENTGDDIALSWAVTIQRQRNGQWSDEVTDLTLIEKCGQTPPAHCVSLAHGGKLRPVPWNGLTCGSQCPAPCRANLYLGPGRFRFVVSSCDGELKYAGPGFDMPAHESGK